MTSSTECVPHAGGPAAVRTFKVRVENLPALRERIDRIERRARRLGIGPVLLEDTGRRERGHAIVALRGETPRLEGWRLAAIVDHRGANAELRPVPGTPVVPSSARWGEPGCDHCRVARQRKETYLLLADDDRTVRQVGSSCLRDFLGGHDPERLCRQAEYLLLAGAELSGAAGGAGVEPGATLELEAFLAHAARVVRRSGWTSRAVATDETPSSADQAEASLEQHAPLEPADRRLARGTLAWARELLPFKHNPSEFERDLAAVVGESRITQRERGLICAAVMIRRRELARARSRSRHQGSIGDHLEVLGLVEHVFARQSGRWRHVHHAILRDLDGNRYRWWSSRPLPIEEHRAYRVRGRVTAHDEHRGELETVLTRCRAAPAVAAG